MKKIFFVLSLIIPITNTAAQTDQSWKVYSDTTLARIDITIDTTVLKWIYANVNSDSEHHATIHFKNKWIDETVDSIGFRLRGNTSRNAKKKSFKISFNSFIKGRKLYSVEKLNLNGEHNDPSIIRSKLSFDLFNDAGVTASRASHAEVYINGAYYGLYVSVEHVDEEFIQKNFSDDGGNLWKCLYPADLKYLGSDPMLYLNVKHDAVTPAYELTTNESSNDYAKLAKLIDVISNTPANTFPDSIEKYLDVRRVLEYFALNTLIGSWDDYRANMNNYYLYHIPSEDKFTLIPYDYDNTFGVDWFNIDWTTAAPYNFPKLNSSARPLSEKLLTNNQYKDLFTHIISFYRSNVTLLPLWESRIDRLKDTITAAAANDVYRTLDYSFTMNDFHNSYSSSSYQNKHVKFGLKQFVNARNASLPAQLSYTNAAPIVYHIDYSPKNPGPNDSIIVTASCFGNAGLKDVGISFLPLGSVTKKPYPMKFAPIVRTKIVEEADRWIGVIHPLGAGNSGTFQIVITDSLNQTQLYPRHTSLTIKTSSVAGVNIVINEFKADNKTFADSIGEFDDWVELFNPTSSPIILTGKYLTDKKDNLAKWKFTQPNLTLSAHEFKIIWCDEQEWQVGIHTNFKLSAGGEFLALTDSDGVTVIDSITFGAQSSSVSYGRFPDGSVPWTFMPATPGAANASVNAVSNNTAIPNQFELSAFPNPFNPSTTIRYSIPGAQTVSIKIFDVLGREVKYFYEGAKETGSYSLRWDGRTTSGVMVGSGIYYLRIETENFSMTKKLMVMK
ncbi:MAG: CotH kinase family protein [Bacteroidota bacterium]|nr:CotH kinase family protein [Bacteroidota bacterium]